MDVREKLVELVKNALAAYGKKINEVLEPFEFIADFMMVNGVTVQEWVSVKDERKPKHDDVTLCYMHSDQYLILRWDDNLKLWFDEDTSYGFNDVAYWQIPQPPKGE